MEKLKAKEQAVLKYLQNCIEHDGYAPSVRDICQACGISSTSSVHYILHHLESKGYIRMSTGKSRAIKILTDDVEHNEMTARVPILGRVTAGTPILAIENYDGYIDYPKMMMRGRNNLFALRVQGTSMIEAGIFDGDIVVVESSQYADDGDIVVALLEDSATVKRFFHEKDCIRLQPENSSMQPIYTKDVSILGKVIANFRFY